MIRTCVSPARKKTVVRSDVRYAPRPGINFAEDSKLNYNCKMAWRKNKKKIKKIDNNQSMTKKAAFRNVRIFLLFLYD